MSTAQELQDRLVPGPLPAMHGKARRTRAPTLSKTRSMPSKARPLATTGIVAAITMFLAREPLMDLAGSVVDGVNAKRKNQENPKGERETE